MKLVLKLLGVVILLVLLAAAGVLFRGSRNLSRSYDIPPHSVSLEGADPVEGQRLATRFACVLCHGGDLAGVNFLAGMPMADLPAPGLSGGRFTPDEIERAVRHGVGADGRPLMIMPSSAFAGMSNEDLGHIISYVQSVPAVSRELIQRRVGPIGRVAAAMAPAELVTGSAIDHAAPHPDRTPVGDGAYLTALCRFCHGEDLGGGVFEAEERMWAANLTAHATGLGGWTFQEFRSVVQEGRLRDGRQVDPNHMPWEAFAAFTDEELETVWNYLHAIPPVERLAPEG